MALIATACSGAQGNPASVHTIEVTERDFQISAPKVVDAGEVILRVHNLGPDAHELLIARIPRGGLPLRDDGLSVSEEHLKQSDSAGLEPGNPHVDRLLPLRLQPGRYLLYCNMSGHFLGGMHAVLVVR